MNTFEAEIVVNTAFGPMFAKPRMERVLKACALCRHFIAQKKDAIEGMLFPEKEMSSVFHTVGID